MFSDLFNDETLPDKEVDFVVKDFPFLCNEDVVLLSKALGKRDIGRKDPVLLSISVEESKLVLLCKDVIN